MDAPLTHVSATAVRAMIAASWLDGGENRQKLGEVVLYRHQSEGARRLHAMLERYGGALLADEVGLGKTYVALALAAHFPRSIVVAPAALRTMWQRASQAAEVPVSMVSHESLSAGGAPAHRPDLVIVDEAHHARNPATRRFRQLERLCDGARVLLLSATPIHNSARDLRALLSLFLGGGSQALDAEALSAYVVRRDHEAARAVVAMPLVRATRWLTIPETEIAARIHALPPPVPLADGETGGALVAHALLRQWSSSAGALVAACDRRLLRAAALEAALEAGKRPSRREMLDWVVGDDAVQLAFPELLAVAPGDPGLLATLSAHTAAVRSLRNAVRADDRADRWRARLVRAVRRRHAGAKIIAFSCFADTVTTLFRRLRSDGRVAAMTATGAAVAGGTLTRGEAIERFAPMASGALEPPLAERIDLLIATDLLSEGINVQDASVVIHLDLPWTPARLEQRVGRVARIGSAEREVSVYVLAPPVDAEDHVAIEALLRRKARGARVTIGSGCAALAGASEETSQTESPVHCAEALRAVIASWAATGLQGENPGAALLTAVVHAPESGFLAVWEDAGRVRLLAGTACAIGDDAALLLRCARLAAGIDADPDPGAVRAAVSRASAWLAAYDAARDAGVRGAVLPRTRHAVARRIAAIVGRAPRHDRFRMAALASAARASIDARHGSSAERTLSALARADLPDEEWLRAVTASGAGRAMSVGGSQASEPSRLLALLILVPRRASLGLEATHVEESRE